jgi:hypothetical protein
VGVGKTGGVVERVIYHIPLKEYLSYCSILPPPWGERMAKVIQQEGERMADRVLRHLSGWPIEIHWGRIYPPYSFVELYIRASEESAKVIGLEELVELRLPLEAGRQTGMTIPTMVGVLDIPHPYYERSQEEVIQI